MEIDRIDMSTPKAAYKGDGAWILPKNFSRELYEKLKALYLDSNAEIDSLGDYPADEFAKSVLAVARDASGELLWLRLAVTKKEVRAEWRDLRRSLQGTEKRLKSLSRDFDRLLGSTADPLGTAEKIAELLSHVDAAVDRVSALPATKKRNQREAAILEDMATDVLRVLNGYEIPASATGGGEFGYKSTAVQILKAIGDDLHLHRAESSWRDIILRVRDKHPDIE